MSFFRMVGHILERREGSQERRSLEEGKRSISISEEAWSMTIHCEKPVRENVSGICYTNFCKF